MSNHNLHKFTALYTAKGWLENAYVGTDAQGIINYVSDKKPTEPYKNTEEINGYALPGFYNTHSHAFQYGMAGMAEKHIAGKEDDFWSWRENMYRCALSLNPDALKTIARNLYQRMVQNGYTHVVEFHYLHHDIDGKPYTNRAETGQCLVEAAADAGIKITLIPIFYQMGDFGKPHSAMQRRFISATTADYYRLLESSEHVVKNYPHASLGVGIHSLRAVKDVDIIKVCAESKPEYPIHIHTNEQLKEVNDSLSFYGKRPVEWLLDNVSPDERFNLVHCTHLSDDELSRLAESTANVVLCPATEGNLGDGLFRLREFTEAGGNWSIGTDSHIMLNPLEELRWLDYGQRLISHRRDTFSDGGATIIDTILPNGMRAAGVPPKHQFTIGAALDAVVYDANNILYEQAGTNHLLAAILYTSDASHVHGTIINGKWVHKNKIPSE